MYFKTQRWLFLGWLKSVQHWEGWSCPVPCPPLKLLQRHWYQTTELIQLKTSTCKKSSSFMLPASFREQIAALAAVAVQKEGWEHTAGRQSGTVPAGSHFHIDGIKPVVKVYSESNLQKVFVCWWAWVSLKPAAARAKTQSRTWVPPSTRSGHHQEETPSMWPLRLRYLAPSEHSWQQCCRPATTAGWLPGICLRGGCEVQRPSSPESIWTMKLEGVMGHRCQVCCGSNFAWCGRL